MTMRTDRIQALLLAAFLAVGAGIVWGIAVGWTLDTIERLAFLRPRATEGIVMLRDGTPLVRTIVPDRWGHTFWSFRTLDGKRRDVAQSEIAGNAPLSLPCWPLGQVSKLSWNQRITLIHPDESSREIWYLVHDGKRRGHAYVVRYDMSARLKSGYIDRHGFRSDMPPLEDQFPIDGRLYQVSRYMSDSRVPESVYVMTDEGLVRIDRNRRQVRLVWSETDRMSVTFRYASRSSDDKRVPCGIFVRTSDRVRVLDMDGNQQQVFILPAQLSETPYIDWATLPDGNALAWSSGKDFELFWLNASGVVREQTVTRQGSLQPRRVDWHSDVRHAMFASFTAPIPAGFALATALTPFEFSVKSDADGYWGKLAKTLGQVWPAVLTVVAIGIVLAWFCYRRQHKYALPWTPLWVALVALFGVPAYLGYLAHRQWPVCLPCPHCGQSVPRDRPACCVCHSDFPAPEPTGTEVFA